jgi:hypothetical protein
MADLKVSGFNCRNCGAPVTPRALTWTQTIVCPSCGTIQDPRDPNVKILQQAERQQKITPRIPMGARGMIHGVMYEVIGFQHRTITVEGTRYGWGEYLLFNPYHGFRYLSEYEGHWNFIRALHAVPKTQIGRTHGNATLEGKTFRHFQTAAATTRYVLGEFPWRIRTGDRVMSSDYVAPPRLLSREEAEGEVTWSLGEYTSGRDVWRWFELPGRPPAAKGIFANQPSPYAGTPSRLWRMFLVLAALLLAVYLGRVVSAARQPVYSHAFRFAHAAGEPSFVTEPFDLPSGPSNVAIDVTTSLDNDWLYLDVALIDAEHGIAFDTGREVSYYHGRDSDGNWTEGSRKGRIRIPQVPAGRYYLRVEPEGNPVSRTPVSYSLTVLRDVPTQWPYAAALALLAIPPVLVTWRSMKFEGRRWAESGDGDTGE